jgi:hypothetical protein
MRKDYEVNERFIKSRTFQILLLFLKPKTPGQVSKEIGISRIKIKPYLDRQQLMPLNPHATKGRLYTLTDSARKLLKVPKNQFKNIEWDLIGWIVASPKQRLVILKTVGLDSVKRTSEQIRIRASNINPHFTRISTKETLNELVNKNLIRSSLIERKRYYWVTDKGVAVVKLLETHCL